MFVYQPKTRAGVRELNSKMARLFYDAPVSTTNGRILLLSLIVLLFLASFPAFSIFYTNLRALAFVEILKAVLWYFPTLIALRYFDRRNRAPLLLVFFAAFSTFFFFAPVAAQTLLVFGGGAFWAAGLIEEFWKVAPLLLIILFAPRAVGGTRDGLIYGALGGLGLTVLEFSAGTEIFSTTGWEAFKDGQESVTFLGTNNQIIWSATVGAAIGRAAVSKQSGERYLLPAAVYILVAGLHIFNDHGGQILTAALAEMLSKTLVVWLPKTDWAAANIFDPLPVFAATVKFLAVNIVLLPVLCRVLYRSGDTERRIIREQLDSEIGGAITREEFEGVVSDRRFRTRRIEDLPPGKAKKLVRMQNELAFHKAFAAHRHEDAETDPPAAALRRQIRRERFEKLRKP